MRIKTRHTETGRRYDLVEGTPGKGQVTKRHAPSGYVAIDIHLAHRMFDARLACTMIGNNVNSHHVFNGWHLGYTWSNDAMTDQSFDALLNNFMFYLDRELGSYPVFFTRQENIKKLESEGK